MMNRESVDKEGQKMSDNQKLGYYFDITVPESAYIENYIFQDDDEICINAKLIISVNDLNEMLNNSSYNSVDYDTCFNAVESNNWWHLNEKMVQKTFMRLSTPISKSSKKTAISYIFITESDKENCDVYFLYIG